MKMEETSRLPAMIKLAGSDCTVWLLQRSVEVNP